MDLPEASEYRRWVETLPVELHGSLMVGDVVPTAFYSARRAGWDFEALAFDAGAAVRRGGGVGVLVERLRTLAKTPPTVSKQGKGDVRFADRILEEFEVAHDPDGERRVLWRQIVAGKFTPDSAALEMASLNARLAEKHGRVKRWRVPVLGWRR